MCEGIAEVRGEMSRLREEEGSFETTALRIMRASGLQTFRHSGVELARVPGEEVLRVRTSKKGATAEVEEEQQPAAPGHEFDQDRQDALEGEDGEGGEQGDGE